MWPANIASLKPDSLAFLTFSTFWPRFISVKRRKTPIGWVPTCLHLLFGPSLGLKPRIKEGKGRSGVRGRAQKHTNIEQKHFNGVK